MTNMLSFNISEDILLKKFIGIDLDFEIKSAKNCSKDY